MLGTPGRWGMVKAWLGRLERVKVFGAIQGDQMSHLVLLFARRRLASALVSFDPLGQLHIESFMLEGAFNMGGERQELECEKSAFFISK